MAELIRKEYNIIAIDPQKMSTKVLLSTLSRYDNRRKARNTRRKLLNIGLEKIVKIQNISKFELIRAQKLQRKSIDELKDIARLRRIKSIKKLTRKSNYCYFKIKS